MTPQGRSAALAGAIAATLVVGCTQLLGADWGARSAEVEPRPLDAVGNNPGPSDAGANRTNDVVSSSARGSTSRRRIALAAHSCAVDAAGRLECWGSNTRGQLALDTTLELLPFARVLSLPEAVASIAAGATFGCALSASGNVHCWEGNESGELGRPLASGTSIDIVPAAVVGLGEPAISIAAHTLSACAVLASGKVACWGNQPLTASKTEWPVVVERSILVGDKPADMEAAVRAGIRGLLFQGGDLSKFLPPAVRDALTAKVRRPA